MRPHRILSGPFLLICNILLALGIAGHGRSASASHTHAPSVKEIPPRNEAQATSSTSILVEMDKSEKALTRRGHRPGRGRGRGNETMELIAACEKHSTFRRDREHCILVAPRIVGRAAEAVRACGEETSFSSAFIGCIDAAADFLVSPAASIRACGDATSLNSQLVSCLEAASSYRYDPVPAIAYCKSRHATGRRVISCVKQLQGRDRGRRR